jgi:hypothetical protein
VTSLTHSVARDRDNASPMAAKILQIVPADSGWRAVYGHSEDPEGSELSRVVAWALVEDDEGKREVVGLVVDPIEATKVVPATDAISVGAGELQRYGFKR